VQPPRLVRLLPIGLCLAVLDCGLAGAEPAAAAWPDTFAVRLQALALLQTLNVDLLSHDSATATLAHWCEQHRMAQVPRIVALLGHGAPKSASPAQRSDLHVTGSEPVRYRHVQLACGPWVLAEADNWYVPSRLTRPMNHLLETTDTPFGVIVRDLHFQRHTLSARLLWAPLPPGWEMNPPPAQPASGNLRVPAEVLEHRAVLSLPDGTPFSEVVETYTGNVLAFPLPQAPAPQR
jgi:chorismate-pyruvate lyase